MSEVTDAKEETEDAGVSMKLPKLDASNSGFESDDDIFVGGTPLMAILCILQARSPIEFMMIQ